MKNGTNIGLIGNPSHAKKLVSGHEGTDVNILFFDHISKRKIFDYINLDAVVMTFFKKEDISREMWQLKLFNLIGIKLIRYWVGTDVLNLKNEEELKYALKLNKLIHFNLTQSPNLKRELQQKGIKSIYLPLETIKTKNYPITLLPKKTAVLFYVPKNETLNKFYGTDLVERTAKKNRDLKFYAIENDNYSPAQKNIINLGFTDSKKAIRKSSVYLRLTKHDGLPILLLESLACGRYVIFSRKMPECYFGKNLAQINRALRNIKNKKNPNYAGAKFVREHFEQKEQFIKLKALIMN